MITILLILLAYIIIAAFVFAAIDDKDQNLLKDYKRVKGTATAIWFWLFWPVVAYKWRNYKKNL